MASSAIPTSCTQIESTVLPAPVDSTWKKFREFALDKVAPAYVESAATVSGVPGQVGSVVRVVYKNGGVWNCRLTEVSDRRHTIAWEVIETEPETTATSVEGEMAFERISDGEQTYLRWTTEFSNDADAQVMADQKYKKLDFFVEFKKTVVA